MLTIASLGFSALVGIAAPAAEPADGAPVWVRDYVTEYAAHVERAGAPIPAWARKYKLDCSACHWPAAPRLNGMGIQFRWAGYRMPDEIGQKVDVTDVGNYMAIRGRMRYDYDKTQGVPATSQFTWNDVTLFYSGPFGKNYSGFFELERAAEDELEIVTSFASAWGKSGSYGGLRAGVMHWLLRDGTAGFDRPTGIRTPTPFGTPITSAIPFRFSNDQLGVEAYYVRGRNRFSGQVLNGINNTGSGTAADPNTNRDYVVTNQFLFNDQGSSITAMGYYGTLVGLVASAPADKSHFWRVGGSANWIIQKLELMGGVAYGKDTDLPTTGAGSFATAEQTGLGYWAQGQYSFPVQNTLWTLFGRYEFVDPNTDVAGNGSKRFVVGTVLPVNLPEYLRLAVEYAHDLKQAAGAPKRNGVTGEVMLNF